MAVIVDYDAEGTDKYKDHAHPGWGGGMVAPSGELFIRVFLGRRSEDIRVWDVTSSAYVRREGPIVEIPLTRMTKQQYQDLKAGSHLLSGRVHHYHIKNKTIKKGPNKDNLLGGAVWLPA